MEVKTEKCNEVFRILITGNRNTQPLLGLDWLDNLEIGLRGNKNISDIRHIETDGSCEKIINQFEALFKNNHTIKDLTIDIQHSKPIEQKGQPVHSFSKKQ